MLRFIVNPNQQGVVDYIVFNKERAVFFYDLHDLPFVHLTNFELLLSI